jgi:hypothetical protein
VTVVVAVVVEAEAVEDVAVVDADVDAVEDVTRMDRAVRKHRKKRSPSKYSILLSYPRPRKCAPNNKSYIFSTFYAIDLNR